MVTWKLTGERMPRTQEEWVQEFTLYQQYPEYKLWVFLKSLQTQKLKPPLHP